MKLPQHSGRWFAVLVVIIILPVFISHPVEVALAAVAGLFLITAWHLMFGAQRQCSTKKQKDRGFRHPPWT
jgi:Flp pilus assembly protein TadB